MGEKEKLNIKLLINNLISGGRALLGIIAISSFLVVLGSSSALAQNLPLANTIPEYDDSSAVSSDGCWVYSTRDYGDGNILGAINAYGQQALDTYSGADSSRLLSSCPKSVIIPSQIDGVDISEIGNAVFYGTDVTSIAVPSTIDEIRNGAFGALHLDRFEFSDAISAYLLGNSGLGPVDTLVYKGKEYKSTDPVDSRCFED